MTDTRSVSQSYNTSPIANGKAQGKIALHDYERGK